MKSPHFRLGALLLLALHMSACVSWTPTALSPRQLIEEGQPPVVRVTKADGTRVVVQSPGVARDSLTSSSEDCRSSVAAGGRLVCESVTAGVAPLAAISLIEVQRTNVGASIAAAFLIPMGLIALLLVGHCITTDEASYACP